MLSSWTFWYSGVSGACWAGPNGLLGSNLTPWPPSRGLIASHWPFQFGYFGASAACAAPIDAITAANTNARGAVTVSIRFLPWWLGSPVQIETLMSSILERFPAVL